MLLLPGDRSSFLNFMLEDDTISRIDLNQSSELMMIDGICENVNVPG